MPYSASRIVVVIGVAFLIAGCSDNSKSEGTESGVKSTPEIADNSLLSDDVREPSATTASESEPSPDVASNVPKPVDKQPRPEPPPKPATVTQAVDITPFANLPNLEGAADTRLEPLELSYSTTASHEEAIDFLAGELSKLGWTEAERKKHNARAHTASFTKQHFVLTVSASSGLFSGNSVNISLTNSGNFDVRSITRPADAEVTHESHDFVGFSTQMPVNELFDFCEKNLTTDGWHEYEMLSEASVAPYGKTAETYIQNGVSLYVIAGPDKDKKTDASYSSRMFAHEMPLPDEVSELKLYGDDPYVRFLTPDDVPTLIAFYGDQAKRSRWQADESRSTADDTSASLSYVIPGGKRIIVEIERQKGGETIVIQRPATPEEGGE